MSFFRTLFVALLLLPPLAEAKEPSFWRNHFARQHAERIEVAEPVPQPETGPLVLLIPGTAIGPEFLAPMASRLRADGFRTVIWAPDDLFTDSLALGAVRIGEAIDWILEEHDASSLYVVAECDGGVASRYYAQVLGGHQEIDHLVTFVSAHHGTRLAGVGAFFSGMDSLRDIRRGSSFMEQLNAAPFPEGFEMTSIYSCHDRLMAPSETSEVAGATNIRLCDPDRKLRHFDGFWDPVVYEHIVETLGRPEAVSAL